MINYRLIKASDSKVSSWSGGKTREICIQPEGSVYADRNFDYRISSATVEIDESDFTPLNGFNRYIMPLDGSMHLIHKDHHEAKLAPFEKDYFSGSYTTKCYGKCMDFNLMLKEGISGDIFPVSANNTLHISESSTSGFFILSDDVRAEIQCDGEKTEISLSKYDYLIMNSPLKITISSANENSDVVAVGVKIFR